MTACKIYLQEINLCNNKKYPPLLQKSADNPQKLVGDLEELSLLPGIPEPRLKSLHTKILL